MKELYCVERYPYGWLICAPHGETGVPITVLEETKPLFNKAALNDPGIARHYRVMYNKQAVYAVVASTHDDEAWRESIRGRLDKELRSFPPYYRWWFGCDVGTSSAAILAVLCKSDNSLNHWVAATLRSDAAKYADKAVPRDADDFNRCVKLLNLMPEWRSRLGEVAAVYPDTAWPAIVASWDELEKAESGDIYRILNAAHRDV